MKKTFVAGITTVVGSVLVLLVAFGQQTARGKEALTPLGLTVAYLPTLTLAPAADGGVPSNASYTVSSAGGPFCIQGMRVDPFTSVPVGPGDAGDVWFNLERIDGNGMSEANVTLVEGASGGFSPRDIVIAYGSPICANSSLVFHAIQWQASQGAGVQLGLSGQIIAMTAQGNTITAALGGE